MIRKGLSSAAFVVAVLAMKTASAVPVSFTDIFDPPDTLMNAKHKMLVFTHDINDDGFNSLTDTLTSARIRLDLRDDQKNDASETVNFNFDGHNQGTYEVNYADFSFRVNVAFLQADGKLVVTLKRKEGDFYFRSSILKVRGSRITPLPPPPPPPPPPTPIPPIPIPPIIIPPGPGNGGGGSPTVPEPATLFLLGLGGASAALFGLLRKKKA